MPKKPLWLKKTARQLVAQWMARKVPSQWCEDEAQRTRLQNQLCRELLWAITERMPDREIADQITQILCAEGETPDAR